VVDAYVLDGPLTHNDVHAKRSREALEAIGIVPQGHRSCSASSPRAHICRRSLLASVILSDERPALEMNRCCEPARVSGLPSRMRALVKDWSPAMRP